MILLLLFKIFSCEVVKLTILGTNDIHGRIFPDLK